MITPAQRERMRQFFGAYFHQDWSLEFDTPDQAVDAFIRQHEVVSDLHDLSRDIEAFVHERPDDEALAEDLFKELGCEYYPPGNGIPTRRWLLDVAAKLATASQRAG